MPRLRPENSNELLSIVSGPLPAGSNGGVRRSNAHGALFHCTQPQAPRLSDQQMLKSEPPGHATAEGRITPLLGQSNPRKNCRAERVEFEAGYVFVYCLEASRVDDRGKRLFLFKNFLHFQIELSALRSINRLLGFLKQVVERFVAPIRVLQCS